MTVTNPGVLRGAKRLQVAFYGRGLGPWGSALPKWGDLTDGEQAEFITLAQVFHDAEAHCGTDAGAVAQRAAEVLAHKRGGDVTARMFVDYMRRRYAEYHNHYLDALAER